MPQRERPWTTPSWPRPRARFVQEEREAELQRRAAEEAAQRLDAEKQELQRREREREAERAAWSAQQQTLLQEQEALTADVLGLQQGMEDRLHQAVDDITHRLDKIASNDTGREFEFAAAERFEDFAQRLDGVTRRLDKMWSADVRRDVDIASLTGSDATFAQRFDEMVQRLALMERTLCDPASARAQIKDLQQSNLDLRRELKVLLLPALQPKGLYTSKTVAILGLVWASQT